MTLKIDRADLVIELLSRASTLPARWHTDPEMLELKRTRTATCRQGPGLRRRGKLTAAHIFPNRFITCALNHVMTKENEDRTYSLLRRRIGEYLPKRSRVNAPANEDHERTCKIEE